jgi:hypothetical protein
VTTSFLALYRGDTVASSKILALTADHQIVQDFAERLLKEPLEADEDLVNTCLEGGRRSALTLIKDGNKRGARPTKAPRPDTLSKGGL